MPRAKNAIFSETDNTGYLVYLNMEQDPKRPAYEQGHLVTGHGDSGMPFWVELDYSPTQKRSIMVAVAHSGAQYSGKTVSSYTNDPREQCRDVATKITKDAIMWFRKKEKEFFEN